MVDVEQVIRTCYDVGVQEQSNTDAARLFYYCLNHYLGQWMWSPALLQLA